MKNNHSNSSFVISKKAETITFSDEQLHKIEDSLSKISYETQLEGNYLPKMNHSETTSDEISPNSFKTENDIQPIDRSSNNKPELEIHSSQSNITNLNITENKKPKEETKNGADLDEEWLDSLLG